MASLYGALDELSALCALVERLGGVELAGVTTHRQMAYAEVGDRTPDEAGRDEGDRLVAAAERAADGRGTRSVRSPPAARSRAGAWRLRPA